MMENGHKGSHGIEKEQEQIMRDALHECKIQEWSASMH